MANLHFVGARHDPQFTKLLIVKAHQGIDLCEMFHTFKHSALHLRWWCAWGGASSEAWGQNQCRECCSDAAAGELCTLNALVCSVSYTHCKVQRS